MDDMAQFRQTYITECFELLADMEARLMQMDAEGADKENLNAIFRDAHSIKGGAGAFQLQEIAEFTHVQETLLDMMREDQITASKEVIDVLLRSRDIVAQMVTAAENEQPVPQHLGQDVVKELQYIVDHGTTSAMADTSQQSGDASHTYHISFVPHANLLLYGNEPLLILKELQGLGDATIRCDTSKLPPIDQYQPDQCYLSWNIVLVSEKEEAAIREVFEFAEDECDLDITIAPKENATAIETDASSSAAATKPVSDLSKESKRGTTSIRVDIDKVDALINMVGEVVITQAMLASQTQELSQQEFHGLRSGIEELSQHTRELQEAVMAIRMQPVKSVFARMPRLTRDLSTKLGKEVTLDMYGQETEVDKTIIEQLSDPLTHLIRNAIDHGIETPDEREQSGKPRMGQVMLSAEHSGGRIIIAIKDDGRGINRERVYQKAVEKGIIPADAPLQDHDIDNLIFAPGFSTADVLSDVSGRGVGMDVVKRNIEHIGGTVQVMSALGKGSTFTISLPLTLAILDGMIIRLGEEFYIIPIANILESMSFKAKDISTVANGVHVVNVRGAFVPLVYLHKYFNVRHTHKTSNNLLVVMVESGQQHIGLVVDELLGQQQVVIKTLEDNADPVEGVSGATILGDGNVSLILDVGALCLTQSKEETEQYEAA